MPKFTILYKVTVDVEPMAIRSTAVRDAMKEHFKQACSSEDTGSKGNPVFGKSTVSWRALATDKIDGTKDNMINKLFE